MRPSAVRRPFRACGAFPLVRSAVSLVVLVGVSCARPSGQLQLSGVEPAEVSEGQWASLLLRGSGFGALTVDLQSSERRVPHAALEVRVADRELAAQAIVVQGPGEARVDFFVDFAPGRLDLAVASGASSWITLPQALSVVAGPGQTAAKSAADAGEGGTTLPLDAGAARPPAGDAGFLGTPEDAAVDALADGSIAPSGRCSPAVANAGSRVLLTFEGTSQDQFGHTTIPTQPEEYAPGGDGCGLALVLQNGRHLTLPDSFDLPTAAGSLEFDVSAPLPAGTAQALVSRDSDLVLSGQVTLYQAGQGDGRLVLRISGTTDTFLCSDQPLAADTWTTVGVNFGLPAWELFVGGVRQTASGSVSLDGAVVTCGGSSTVSLASFQLDWLLGATARDTEFPSTLRAFATANIDNFHLSASRL